MPSILSEDQLCALFAHSIRTSPDFAEWFLGHTQFGSVASTARLLIDEQEKRPAKAWWRHWWCNVPSVGRQSETDIFLVFEAPSTLRFALHVENKRDAPFSADQAGDYRHRAARMRRNRWVPYSEFETMLIAPGNYIDANQTHADLFDSVVAYEEIARHIPEFGAAREKGLGVLMLERAPEAENGGNSRFTAGAIRFAYSGVDDLKSIMPELTPEEIGRTDFGTYSTDQFFDDMFLVTRYRTDPDVCEQLVTRSLETMQWMHAKGVKFAPIYGRQAFKIDGKFKFWGGLTVEAWGGGPGLVDQETAIARSQGIEIRYGARAMSLVYDGYAVTGVRVKHDGEIFDLKSKAVIIAAGGFQSNTEWRTRYLGAGWELAKVRGTRFNTGDGIRMALEIGASSHGNWSGCHAVGWDHNAPEYGDLTVGDNFQKHSYPFGIMVNATGRRFLDEGADFRNYTYAKYGRAILEQPDHFAWQIFDQQVTHLLRDEYRIKQCTKVTADTLEELASKLEDVDAGTLLDEIRRYNAAVKQDIAFNPNEKDGRGTEGLEIPKSNWANTIDEGPFEAYQVGCGITFTFGGLRIDPTSAQVMDTDLQPIPGLYAAGELVGGIFYFNYPGGTGLMSGSVFGKIAGTAAGEQVKAVSDHVASYPAAAK